LPWIWNENGISMKWNLTIKFIYKFRNKPWNWNILSYNKSIMFKIIDLNYDFDYKFNWDGISQYNNLSMDFIYTYRRKLNWNYICANKNITLFDIKEYSFLPWKFDILSNNNNISFEFILKHLRYNWDWSVISMRSDITIFNIENNLQLPWHWFYGISSNPNITIEFIRKVMKIKSTKLHINLSWDLISLNENILMIDIANNLDLPWNWNVILHNRNITFNFIDKYSDKITGWQALKYNKFKHQKRLFINDKYREYIASYKIQKWWITDILYNPKHPVGKIYQAKKYKKEVIDE